MGSPKSLGAVTPRQALFFLLAIVAPCALLVALTLRTLVQERELAEQRLADEHARTVADVRQELLARVEQIRRQALPPGGAVAIANGRELALVAPVVAGRLVMPWDRDDSPAAAAAALDHPSFREAVQAGEREEFVANQFSAAAAAYARAAQVPGATDLHRAAAQLLLARALTKARRTDAANAAYRQVLAASNGLVDDQGIPFALYAARRLLDSAATPETDGARIAAALESVLSSPTLRPATLYMARDLIRDLRQTFGGALLTKAAQLDVQVTARTTDIEQALELQKSFSAPALIRAATADAPLEPTWMPFGPPMNEWLVSYGGPADGPLVVAVRADAVLRQVEASPRFATGGGAAIRIASSGPGDLLLPNFPALHVVIPPEATAALARDGNLRRPVYVVALVAVLSTALFGAYLFWRDVRREIRIAELRSQFVSSVSHELKTPLTAIRMFAETLLLGRSVKPEVSQEYLETIVQESERLTRLLNNVLDFSKIEQGTKTYRLEPHSPASMVRTAGKAMHYPLAQQGFDLRVTVDDNVPAVAADADAIQQAILNLLSNAMKYSGDGRAIELELKQDGQHAVISVTDHGIGIPAAEQARIFQKFYRVPGLDNHRIAGTGLGLTLVEHVARAHGGSVAVRSAPGEGSTFSLLLPVEPDAEPATSTAKALA